MSTYTKPELEALWFSVNPGNGSPHLMAAIALAESAGNSSNVNSIGACGLWQIHPYQAGCLNPVTNAMQAGKKLRAQGLGAWESYTNGSYRQFLGGGEGAARQGGFGGAQAAFGLPPPLGPGPGIPGLPPIPNPFEGAEGLLEGNVPNPLAGIEKLADTIKKLFAWIPKLGELFFTPSGWVRLGKLGIGVTLLLIGVFGMANVGTVETVKQGSSLGRKAVDAAGIAATVK